MTTTSLATVELRAYPTADRWWSPPPTSPVTSSLSPSECALLRDLGTQALLTAEVLGSLWPRDLLTSPAGRVRALRPWLQPAMTLMGAGALWVHTGDSAPDRIVVASTDRSGATRRTVARRVSLPPVDVVEVAGQRCTSLERTAVDLARTAPPLQAVQAVLRARGAGVPRTALLAALERCRGSCSSGRPRARAIIHAIYDGGPPPPPSTGRPGRSQE
ncbi:hypothetical protein [Actinomyces faecalis]|uniref:hypothetical protein n=1 Tax=Actinomyces faecalis TaxID=2722820 RepID=UPI001553B4D4|nr:hypothetical protein [Actinomyces faecalis]